MIHILHFNLRQPLVFSSLSVSLSPTSNFLTDSQIFMKFGTHNK
jgi:hypothetical protein